MLPVARLLPLILTPQTLVIHLWVILELGSQSEGKGEPLVIHFRLTFKGGSYVHARGSSVYHVFRHITEHAATALQYFIGTETETTLHSLLFLDWAILMNQLPFKPISVVWSSFLRTCKVFGELELRREAAYKLFELLPHSVVPYLTLANLYAGDDLWSKVDEMRRLMILKGLRKSSGWSWIEIEKKVNVFLVGDLSHLHTWEIYVELDNLIMKIKDICYFLNK
ncbi:hypothetical protein LguiB_018771 [Lonicera macranthoides]